MWKMETPIIHSFQRASTSPRPQYAASSILYEVFKCRAYRKNFSYEIQWLMRRPHSPYRMYLIRKLCTALGSTFKEGPYDFRLFNISRFKAHTIMEDNLKMWILVRVVLVANDRFSNAIISDINGGLFSCGLSALSKNCIYCTSCLTLKTILKSHTEDITDQRRISNADLDHYEHITEGINVITDISDEEDTESICENSLFKGHEATLHGLLTLGMLREFF